jgi:formamidopyrimidine-DNA glycosylase
MPERPDIQIYLEALERRVLRHTLEDIRVGNPFFVRSVQPPIDHFSSREVVGISQLGKRIVFEFPNEYFLILHLMIAGRLHWKKKGVTLNRRNSLAAFDFPDGTFLLTEAGSKRRASLYAIHGRDNLAEHDRGGVDSQLLAR